ncbi:MAG: Uma2 family endonuclease [Myxococcota bacterium]
MTFQDVAGLDPDREPGELVAGEMVPVTRTTWRHAMVVASLTSLLKQYCKARPDWVVGAGDPGSKLATNPDTLRGPDVGLLRRTRLPIGKGADGRLDGAPELVCEVVGDSQSPTELLEKALAFLAAGSQVVWLADPEPQRVLVVTPPDHVRILGRDDVLEAPALIPGFRCAVRELFE